MKTVLTFVQDETGSMLARRETTISAFNEYFDTLKNSDKDLGEIETVLWQFSDSPGEDRVRLLYEGALDGVPQLGENYQPRGNTPLLDAVGTAIQQADAKQADRYLFIVQTDGAENSSREFTRERVAALISEKEQAANWTVVFLGAGINEWAGEAATMGVSARSTMSYGAAPVATVTAYASLGTTSLDFLATEDLALKGLGAKAEAKLKESSSSGTNR